MSHPSWVCGLKPWNQKKSLLAKGVTPFVGVWIETHILLPEWMLYDVTPFVGVWIETFFHQDNAKWVESHPSWVCGLKLRINATIDIGELVTPFVGVWIETGLMDQLHSRWKSHPSWVCGLKPKTSANLRNKTSHTLRGCVDWNQEACTLWEKSKEVTPFVGVWIETYRSEQRRQQHRVTPFVGVWIETFWCNNTFQWLQSHPSWVCGLKQKDAFCLSLHQNVTPFVGVWIET